MSERIVTPSEAAPITEPIFENRDSSRAFAFLEAACLAALLWYGMTELLRLRLQVWEWCLALVTWWLAIAAVKSWQQGASRVFSRLLSLAAMSGICAVQSRLFRHPLTVFQVGYALGALTAVSAIWKFWRVPEGVSAKGEAFRRMSVLILALFAMYPFFTDRFVGGIDARWYAFMLSDFVEQARAGVFPIFLGQGEHAYNGAVHPFRSAPIYLWLAGAWDLLTFRVLSTLALQHLTALTAAAAAGLGMYAALVGMAPARRWWAAVVALIYVFSPGVLASLYCSDMYMTFMAVGVLPLVIYGNASMFQEEVRGGRLLAAGLVLTWMCHPPIGLLASIASALMQSMRIALSAQPAEVVKRIGPAALWFVGLGFFYFYSMSEVPNGSGLSFRQDVLFFSGLGLITVGVMQAFWRGRYGWLSLLLPGCALLKISLSPWLWWVLFFVIFAAVGSRAKVRFPGLRAERGVVIWMLVMGLLAAAVAWQIEGKNGQYFNLGPAEGLARYSVHWVNFFRPLSSDLSTIWDYQPGAAVWLLFVTSILFSFVASDLSGPLFTSAAVLIVISIVRIPTVSDFLLDYSPQALSRITNLPLALRIMPVAAAFACGAGFLAFARRKNLRGEKIFFAAAVFALIWSGWEARRFFAAGRRFTMPRAHIERRFLPENAIMDRFVYDLLRVPDYYSHGKTDPWLDTRILNLDEGIRFGPDELARQLENQGDSQTFTLRWETKGASANWPKIIPGFSLQPGEKILLRFDFEPAEHRSGYIVFHSDEDDYREYKIPESGMVASFGSGPYSSKTLSFWNTTSRPVDYKLSFIKEGQNDSTVAEGVFATVHLSKYHADLLPLKVESFLPYRARVRLDEPGLIETPRYFMPGYKASIDGKPAPIESSLQSLAMVRLPVGEHQVELRYVGTWKLWSSAVISAITWAAFLLFLWRERRASRPNLI